MTTLTKEIEEYFEDARKEADQNITDAINSLNEVKYFIKQALMTSRSEMKQMCVCFVDEDGSIKVHIPLFSDKDPCGYHTNIDLEEIIKIELRSKGSAPRDDDREEMAKALETLAAKVRIMRIRDTK